MAINEAAEPLRISYDRQSFEPGRGNGRQQAGNAPPQLIGGLLDLLEIGPVDRPQGHLEICAQLPMRAMPIAAAILMNIAEMMEDERLAIDREDGREMTKTGKQRAPGVDVRTATRRARGGGAARAGFESTVAGTVV